MNLNELARLVTLTEGKKQSLSIAQVKEVIRITFDILGTGIPAQEYHEFESAMLVNARPREYKAMRAIGNKPIRKAKGRGKAK